MQWQLRTIRISDRLRSICLLNRRPAMIVCICRRVSDRDIQRAVREGIGDFEVLQDETGVASHCGACHDCAHEVFREAHAAHTGCAGHCHAASQVIQLTPAMAGA